MEVSYYYFLVVTVVHLAFFLQCWPFVYLLIFNIIMYSAAYKMNSNDHRHCTVMDHKCTV